MKGTELALIFDVGTQATRALVFDTKGEPVLIVKQPGKRPKTRKAAPRKKAEKRPPLKRNRK